MDNLEELNVFLQDPSSPEWDDRQCYCLCLASGEIIAPLWKVKRGLRVFEVDVPWTDTSSWEYMESSTPITEGAPFNLTERGITPVA